MVAGSLSNLLLSVDKPAGVRVDEHLVEISLPELSLGTRSTLVIPSPVLRGFTKASSCHSVKLRSKINGYFRVVLALI